MSKLCRYPIQLPQGFSLEVHDGNLIASYQDKKLIGHYNTCVGFIINGNSVKITPSAHYSLDQAKMHMGTTAANIRNMIIGLTTGFTKTLKLHGLGYKATLDNKTLSLSLNFSHLVSYTVPEGVDVALLTATEIRLTGTDKALVGQTAAKIRSYRKPEPYKGRGIRYSDEVITYKEIKRTKK